MKKTAIFLAFFMLSVSGAFASLTSKGYVDTGLATKQDTLSGTGAVTVDQENNTVSVADATQTTKGVVKYGTIPTSSNGTGEAFIWVE